MPTTRVLVVDDHAVVRRMICQLLAKDATLDVICQTASGEEAVSKAEELQPDLILLDITLPGISGIEAARAIFKVSPKSQIIFLSQHESAHMVHAALKTGAHGYVTKLDAGSDLLKAIRSLLEGTRFMSERVPRLVSYSVCSSGQSTPPRTVVLLLTFQSKHVTKTA